MNGRRPRLRGFSYVGFHRYFLTLCVRGRREVFTDAALVAALLEQISRAAADWHFAVLAYSFMPDHLHLLVTATTEDSALLEFAHAVKQLTGYAYRQWASSKLWQKGYFDRVLRDTDSTEAVARYIFLNPVVAGLCKDPREYPFAGSLVWSADEIDAILGRNG
jgi:putative transposase